jgi:hypothetical protein
MSQAGWSVIASVASNIVAFGFNVGFLMPVGCANLLVFGIISGILIAFLSSRPFKVSELWRMTNQSTTVIQDEPQVLRALSKSKPYGQIILGLKKLQHMLHQAAGYERTLAARSAADATVFSQPGIGTTIGFVIVALLASIIYFSTDNFLFSGRPLQILLVCMAGYRYGPRIGLLGGGIFFLPNLIIYLVFPEPLVGRNDYLLLAGMSSIVYLLHAGLGYGAGIFKVALPPARTEFRPSTRWLYLIWLPIYMTAFELPLPYYLTIDLRDLAAPIMMLVAFHYGPKRAYGLILGYLPIAFMEFSTDYWLYGGVVSGPELLLLLMGVSITAQFRVRPPSRLGAKFLLYNIMLFLAILLSLEWSLAENVRIYGYPFALGMIFTAGFLFGSRRGFRFGIIWGIATSLVRFIIVGEILYFGGEWWFSTLAAPIIGYWAGNLRYAGITPLFGSILRLFSGLYALRLYLKLLSGSTPLLAYLEIPAGWLQAIMAASFLVVLLKRFRIEEIQEKETTRFMTAPSDEPSSAN